LLDDMIALSFLSSELLVAVEVQFYPAMIVDQGIGSHPKGMYYYQLRQDGMLLRVGKLVLQ